MKSLESNHNWQSALKSFSVSWVGPKKRLWMLMAFNKSSSTPSTTSSQAFQPVNVLTNPPPLLRFISKFHKWRKATGQCHHAIWLNSIWRKYINIFFPIATWGGKVGKHGLVWVTSDHYYLPLVSPARNCRPWRTKSDQHEAEENQALMGLAGDDCHIWTFSSNWGVKMKWWC